MILTGEKTILRPATLNDRRKIFEWLTASDLTPELMGAPNFPEIEIPSWEDFRNDAYFISRRDHRETEGAVSYLCFLCTSVLSA